MTIAFLAALVAVNIAYLVLLDRRDTRDRAERAALHQRFQAPQAAIYEHHAAVTPAGPESPAGGMPMSDEEIALMQAREVPDEGGELARIIARMEAAENGTVQLEDGLLQ